MEEEMMGSLTKKYGLTLNDIEFWRHKTDVQNEVYNRMTQNGLEFNQIMPVEDQITITEIWLDVIKKYKKEL